MSMLGFVTVSNYLDTGCVGIRFMRSDRVFLRAVSKCPHIIHMRGPGQRAPQSGPSGLEARAAGPHGRPSCASTFCHGFRARTFRAATSAMPSYAGGWLPKAVLILALAVRHNSARKGVNGVSGNGVTAICMLC